MGLFNRKSDSAISTVSAATVDPALATLTGTYQIDPAHSSIGFTVRHAMVTNVRGTFASHEGTLQLDGNEPHGSVATIDIDIASVDTDVTDRDKNLRSGDFFDAERFPRMSFRSTEAEQTGDDKYRITGELTIKDVTRRLSIDLEFQDSATDVYGNERVGFERSTTRKQPTSARRY
ncbi:YceI family protein [Streptomyces parvus]|uniref:YceI family protein n=1 Tax=Streptomyces parvus TaxID=66428 RepID=UPI0033F028B6